MRFMMIVKASRDSEAGVMPTNEWAKRAPFQEGELELRQFFELEDFAPGEAIEEARALGKMIGKI